MFRSRESGLRDWLIVGTAVLSVVLLLATVSTDIAWATPPQQGGGGTVPPREEEEEEEPVPPIDLPVVE
ncbi:MAG: hypothetical protein JSV81_07120, partial [Anaerolineales bacterium]